MRPTEAEIAIFERGQRAEFPLRRAQLAGLLTVYGFTDPEILILLRMWDTTAECQLDLLLEWMRERVGTTIPPD